MSYCRFGTNKHKSDAYIWYDRHGWTIALARKRRVNKKFVDIGLPLDGKHFSYKTRQGLLKKIEKIQKIGYYVPITAIWRLKREIREEYI